MKRAELIDKFLKENPQYQTVKLLDDEVIVQFHDQYNPDEDFTINEFIPDSPTFNLLKDLEKKLLDTKE